MKFKATLAVLPVMLCANAMADPVYQPPGPNLTYGSSSNNQSIMSSIANPAAAAAQLGKEDSQYRFGILNIGGGYEIGNVNNLFNQINKASQDLKSPTLGTTELTALAAQYATDCPTGTCSPAQLVTFSNSFATIFNNSQTIATLNTVLNSAQQDGNATSFFGGHLPFTPFVISRKGWGGSFVLDVNASAIANMTFIAEPLNISPPTATAFANAYIANPVAPVFPTPPNDSTALAKVAVVGELGLGYSRSVLRREAPEPVEGEPTPGKFSASQLKAGELTAGGRLKFYEVGLANQAISLNSMQGGSQNVLKDSRTYTKTTGFGLDVGGLWTSKHYRAGAGINNINSPSFKYPAINITGYTNQNIIAQLQTSGTYTMKPQLQLEGAVYSESQNFVANLGLDANAVQDPVGRDFQWMTLSGAYATSSWWIPGARVGYRTNLAGSKLSYLTAGLTMFKALSLDIAYGLDKLTYEGKSIPRSAMFNLGLQMTF